MTTLYLVHTSNMGEHAYELYRDKKVAVASIQEFVKENWDGAFQGDASENISDPVSLNDIQYFFSEEGMFCNVVRLNTETLQCTQLSDDECYA